MSTIPSEFEKIVAFLCTGQKDGQGSLEVIPRATAFFVRVKLGEPYGSTSMEYLVTARHVIEKARAAGGALYLRLNKIGGIIDVPISIDDWSEHDTADVAALLMSPDDLPDGIVSADLDQAGFSLNSSLDENYQYSGPTDFGPVDVTIAPGHDVYLLGLFSNPSVDPGYVTIARFGHISRMPTIVEVESGQVKRKILAYLMEFQSWGGHSGAPVFFRHPILVETATDRGTTFDTGWVLGLAGLVSGHFGISEKKEQASGEIIRYEMNSGIAMVTPSHLIRELLFREDIVEERFEKAKSIAAGNPA